MISRSDNESNQADAGIVEAEAGISRRTLLKRAGWVVPALVVLPLSQAHATATQRGTFGESGGNFPSSSIENFDTPSTNESPTNAENVVKPNGNAANGKRPESTLYYHENNKAKGGTLKKVLQLLGQI